MRRLTLTEYRTEPGVALNPGQRDSLRAALPSLAIAPSSGSGDRYDLTPGSVIGAVAIHDLLVVVQPKLPIDRVLFLVSYAVDPDAWRDQAVDFAAEPSLHEAMVPGFVHHLRRAFRRGLLQGYRTTEDSLNTVRGRIRFDDQIRDRFGVFPPIDVRFDDFTEDIDPNRLLKAAIHRLGKLPIRSVRVRNSLRAFDAVLGRVTLVEYGAANLPAITWTRLNEHYRPAVQLARLILRSTSVELGRGETRSSAFLVDMNQVFEDFVVRALRDALGLSERSFPQGDGRLRLDRLGSVRLEPDLSWWRGDRCVFVGDVKYKTVSATGIKHSDLYQVLAYAVAADLPGGLLVYAAGERNEASHEVVNVGRRLDVLTLDLAGKPAGILQQIERVAGRVRLMAGAGLARAV